MATGKDVKKKYVHKEHNKAFPGDFKNFSESSQLKEAKEKANKKYKEDKQHPVKGKHAGFDRLVNSGKVEQDAFKKYRKDTAETRDKNKLKSGGRAGYQGGGRTNLLEELGRVEGESSNRNRRAEVSRIHGELNRGYKKGGRAGYKHGGAAIRGQGCEIKS